MIPNRLFLLFATFSCLPGPAAAEKPLIGDFRMRWKPGATYEQKMVVTQKVAIPLRGTANATTELDLRLQPKSGQKAATLGMEIARFKTLVDMPAPTANESFDSTTPDEGNADIRQFYTNLQAAKLTASLDEKGQVTGLVGLSGLTAENPLLSRFLGQDQVAALLKQGWFLSMPPKSIGIGGSWPYRLVFPTPLGKMKMEGTYTLLGSEQRGPVPCWKLEVKGGMTGEVALQTTEPVKEVADNEDGKLTEEELNAKLAKLGLSVASATTQGFIWFNPAEQLIHDSEITTDIKIGVANPPVGSKNVSIPISQKVVLELRKR
jgi:hypothetical protein